MTDEEKMAAWEAEHGQPRRNRNGDVIGGVHPGIDEAAYLAAMSKILASPGGRPALGVRRVSLTLGEDEIALLRAVGNGNASAGVRRLLAEKAEEISK